LSWRITLLVRLTSEGSRPASFAAPSSAGRTTSVMYFGDVNGCPSTPSATRPEASIIFGFTAAM
jgi:hypothetical protein